MICSLGILMFSLYLRMLLRDLMVSIVFVANIFLSFIIESAFGMEGTFEGDKNLCLKEKHIWHSIRTKCCCHHSIHRFCMYSVMPDETS